MRVLDLRPCQLEGWRLSHLRVSSKLGMFDTLRNDTGLERACSVVSWVNPLIRTFCEVTLRAGRLTVP